jgi:hypothetical protein
MGNGRDYRAKAVEFSVKARRTRYPDIAAIYAGLTLRYQRLADWIEHRQAGSRPRHDQPIDPASPRKDRAAEN